MRVISILFIRANQAFSLNDQISRHGSGMAHALATNNGLIVWAMLPIFSTVVGTSLLYLDQNTIFHVTVHLSFFLELCHLLKLYFLLGSCLIQIYGIEQS